MPFKVRPRLTGAGGLRSYHMLFKTPVIVAGAPIANVPGAPPMVKVTDPCAVVTVDGGPELRADTRLTLGAMGIRESVSSPSMEATDASSKSTTRPHFPRRVPAASNGVVIDIRLTWSLFVSAFRPIWFPYPY